MELGLPAREPRRFFGIADENEGSPWELGLPAREALRFPVDLHVEHTGIPLGIGGILGCWASAELCRIN